MSRRLCEKVFSIFAFITTSLSRFSALIIKLFSPSPSFLQFHLLGAEVCSSPQPFLVFLCWLQLCPCLFFCASKSSHEFQDVPVAPVLFDSFALYTSMIASTPKNPSWIPAVPNKDEPLSKLLLLLHIDSLSGILCTSSFLRLGHQE